MKTFSVRCFLVILALRAAALGAQGHAPALMDTTEAQRGRKEFVQSCGFCHGDDATGSRGPDLVRSPLVNRDTNGDLIAPVIRNGRPDKGMPGFPLSSDVISEMVAFLHGRVQQAMRSSHIDKEYPVARLLTGSAEAGKAYFNGEGKCASCHSSSGDLAGIARKYPPLELEERFLSPHATAVTLTVTTSSGEQVSGKLAHLDEFSVALRDSEGWYHSWRRDTVKVSVHDPLQAHHEMLAKYTDADVHNLFAYLETLK